MDDNNRYSFRFKIEKTGLLAPKKILDYLCKKY